MFVIKVKDKELYYNNRNNHGLHDDINMADVYNTKKGAAIALRTFKQWWGWQKELKFPSMTWMSEINDFDAETEIREVEVKLK